jgi:hypothetical protein
MFFTGLMPPKSQRPLPSAPIIHIATRFYARRRKTIHERFLGCLVQPSAQKWEEEGGRRREFLDLAVDLHELLDRRPWEVDVFYVDAMKPSDDQDQGDWVGAAAARRALVAALQQQSEGMKAKGDA